MQEVRDEELMQRAGGGDRLAAQLLMRRHLPKMLHLARHILRHESDAEDAVQEAFLKLWQHAGRWKPGKAKLETWLYRVVLNQCLDHLRQSKHRKLRLSARAGQTKDETGLESIPDTAPLAEAELSAAEDAARVQAALTALPERQRIALTLCHLQGLGNIEAAAVMKISVEALESLLGRGRRGLRKSLAGLWDEVRS